MTSTDNNTSADARVKDSPTSALVTVPSMVRGLLGRGLAVFPLPAGSKRAEPGWHRRVTTDSEQVSGWPAAANVGIACRASGVVVLDLDRHPGGDADGVATWSALWAAARRPPPATFTVSTAHDGRHVYFAAPAGLVVASSIGRWPGIDVRAPGRALGGYLVGPGSVVDGRPYRLLHDRPLAPLPGWLAHRLGRPHPSHEGPG